MSNPANSAPSLDAAVERLQQYLKARRDYNEMMDGRGKPSLVGDLSESIDTVLAALAEARADSERSQKIAAEGRKAGREEALRIIMDFEAAETSFDEYIVCSPMGDTGDFSHAWDETKLRKLFDLTPESAMRSRLDDLEGLYWEQCMTIDGLKAELDQARRATE